MHGSEKGWMFIYKGLSAQGFLQYTTRRSAEGTGPVVMFSQLVCMLCYLSGRNRIWELVSTEKLHLGHKATETPEETPCWDGGLSLGPTVWFRVNSISALSGIKHIACCCSEAYMRDSQSQSSFQTPPGSSLRRCRAYFQIFQALASFCQRLLSPFLFHTHTLSRPLSLFLYLFGGSLLFRALCGGDLSIQNAKKNKKNKAKSHAGQLDPSPSHYS